jgi:hypothetical protein
MVQRALFFLSTLALTMVLAYAIHQNPEVLMSGLKGTVPRPEWWPRGRVVLNLLEGIVPFVIWVSASWAYVRIATRRFYPARNFIRLAAFIFVAQVYVLIYGLPRGWGWPLSLLLVTVCCEVFSSDYLKRSALDPSIPPSIVLWEMLPDLTVGVFGSIDQTPDLENIRNAYGKLVRHVFAMSQSTPIENKPGVDEAYARKVSEQLKFEEIPDVSEMGSNDRAHRLFSVNLMGMVWLLLNEGAGISERDASLIPAVVSEFAREPLCVMIQGRGHHLFLKSRLARRLCIGDGRSLWSKAEASGLIAKRVTYITIGPESNDRFDLL